MSARTLVLALVLLATPAHAQIAITQLGNVDAARGKCTIRPTGGATIYARIIAGGLSHAEVLHHAATRLGYGASPIGPLVVSAANDCSTVFIADEIARQVSSLGARTRAPELTTVRRGLTPLLSFTRAELNEALWRLKNSGADGTAAAGTLGWEARTSLAFAKTLRELVGSQRLVNGSLVDVQVELDELMLELWLNHFNVELEKAGYASHGSDGYAEVLRTAHGGTFAALLKTVMKQPAMLVYLDNHTNQCDPSTGVASNQNLARELLELHTLGLPPTTGVYGQTDVEAMATALCGWNTHPTSKTLPAGSSGFVYNDMLAYPGTVTILGQDFAPGAGRVPAVLDHLAARAETKQAICTKLSARFYAPALRAAATTACTTAWGSTGNLRTIVQALIARDAFWTSSNYRTLQRTPIELIVAVGRRIGVRLTDLSSAVTAANLTDTPYQPAGITPTIVDDLATLRAAPPYRFLINFMSRMQTMLGTYRMKVAPPIGYPMDGAAFLSTSYLDDASRLGIEVAGTLNQLGNRTDLSSSAEKTAVDNHYASATPAATVEWFAERRMKLGNVIAGTAAAPYLFAAAHTTIMNAVLGAKSSWAIHASFPTTPRGHDTLLGLTTGSAHELWR